MAVLPTCGWSGLAEVAESYGTPLWVVDGPAINLRLSSWDRLRGIAPLDVFYSVKANPSPAILEAVSKAGLGLDLASAFDVHAARQAGFSRSALSFCSKSPAAEDIQAALACGTVVAGSGRQVYRWTDAGRQQLGLRINTGISAGFHEHVRTAPTGDLFGVPLDEAASLVGSLRRRGAEVIGLHSHLGSDILETGPHLEAANRLLELSNVLGDIEWINIGGGYGVPFDHGEPYDLDGLGRGLRDLADTAGADIRFRCEPGTHIAREAGWLVVSVVSVDERDGVQRVECDSSVNHLPGALLYGTQHPVRELGDERDELAGGEVRPTLITGNLMQPGDILAISASLPRLRAGSMLAFGLAGAYTSVRACTFNGRPLPAEVWLDEEGSVLVRRRRTPAELHSDEFVV
jgi:diaminopimelate decarboxylase